VVTSFPKGGIHPPERKLSSNKAIINLPLPKTVCIPLIQHLGIPADPIVKTGQRLKTGQLIAKATGFISANVHSSVTGTIKSIEDVMDSSGNKRKSVIIDVEPDVWEEGIDSTAELIQEVKLSPEQIVKIVKDKGLVGMGGATFPTHVKLTVPKGKNVDAFILNGVECEPYLTSDHRLMIERTEEILIGTKNIMCALGVNKAFIGIEINKPDAISAMRKLTPKFEGIEVSPLKVKYPQGGEKQLIKAILNREVPSGGLPSDVGVIVHNVATTFAVYEAVQKNKPIISRVVTVTGKSVRSPGNFRARIGTSFFYLIHAAGGLTEDTRRIISGGPLMGKAQSTMEVPVIKGTSGILLLTEQVSGRQKILNCIRCAKCNSACPMGLEPYILMILSQNKRFDVMKEYSVMDCIECGSCSYTCPSKRPLLDYIRLGKITILKNKKTG